MFRKLNTIIACLNTEHSNYILELNEYLKKYDRNITTLATENKRIYVNNKWTGLYRPMICFDFNKKKDMHLCFFMTGNKDYHRYGDPRFYFFNSNDKLRIDNPIWVPTKYLVEIEFDKQIQKFVDIKITTKYVDLKRQYEETIKNKDKIWDQYLDIKYCRINQPLTIKAYEQMIIRDQLSEKFCNLELKKIKQQKLLLTKSKQNESGGSSGTPIEESNNEYKLSEDDDTQTKNKQRGMAM